MKASKLLTAVPILALSASAIIAWSALTRAETPSEIVAGTLSAPDSVESSLSLDPAEDARVSRMDARINLLASRLGMAAPMEENSLLDSEDLRRKYAEGMIVDATIEQVESAISAAAKTPGTGDDIDALILKHRGTYRYFAPD